MIMPIQQHDFDAINKGIEVIYESKIEVDPIRWYSDALSSADCWKYWQSHFQKSTGDLLSNYVDPVEERHMDLLPDDESSKAAKTHSRKYKGKLSKAIPGTLTMKTRRSSIEDKGKLLPPGFAIPTRPIAITNSRYSSI